MASFNLAKNQTFDLTKGNAGLKRVFMGLGWDVAKPKAAGGFFGRILSAPAQAEDIDLDASCLMFDAGRNLVDVVWFRRLKSRDGSIVHTGDNRTGAGDGDDEVINIDLSRVPANVQSLVFTINSFRGQTFETIEAAVCRVVNQDSGEELVRYSLSGKGKHTAQVMAKLVRGGSGWTFQAIGETADGRTYEALVPAAQRCL